MYDIIDALNDALTGNLSRVMQKTGSRGVAVYRHPPHSHDGQEGRFELDLKGPQAMAWLTSVSKAEPSDWYYNGQQRHARLEVEGARIQVIERTRT